MWYKYNPETQEFTSYSGPSISMDLVTLNNPMDSKVQYVSKGVSPPPRSSYSYIGALDLETKVYTNVTANQYYIGKNEGATQVGNFSYSVEGNSNMTIIKTDLTTGVMTRIPTGVKPKYYYITSLTYKGDGVFYITVNRTYYYSSDRPSDDSLKVDLYEWTESTNTLIMLASNISIDWRSTALSDSNQYRQFQQSMYSIYESGRIYFVELYSERNSSSSTAGHVSYLRHFVLNVEQRKLELLQAETEMTFGSLMRAGDRYFYTKNVRYGGVDLLEYYYQKD